MRITANQVMSNMLYVINNRYSNLTNLQEQMSTGKRLLRPSDNPVDVANDIKLKTKLSQLTQFKKNMEDGLAYMGVTDTSMNSMNDLMQRFRELAIQGSSDTISSTERMYLNKEVEQLSRQVISLVNTQYKGDYIFNGTETKIPPLILNQSRGGAADDYSNLRMAYYDGSATAVGGSVQLFNGFDGTPVSNILPGTFELQAAGVNYVEGVDYTVDYKTGMMTIQNPALLADVSPGSANYVAGQFSIQFDSVGKGKDIYGSTVSNKGQILRQIEPDITSAINISADEFLQNNTTGDTLLGTVIELGQSLLTNNQAGIQGSIDNIDAIFKNILSAQSKNGARMNRFDTTLGRNEGQFTNTTELQAELEDADMAQTITDFMNTQNIYDAALKTAAGVIQQSLVNFL